jgi:tetratricopeptide (TPR) repeat protein
MKTNQINLILCIALTLGCGSPGTSDWDARLTSALCLRAERLMALGEVQDASHAAQRALERALELADASSEARARQILGLVERSPEQLVSALELLGEPRGEPEAWRTGLILAHLALQAGQLDSAEAHLKPVLEASGSWKNLRQKARAEAMALHIRGAIHRGQGSPAQALSHERQADLQLTILPKGEMVPLRLAVAQALGDHYSAAGMPRDAYLAHAHAAQLAERLGRFRAVLIATRCVSRDLLSMDRLMDAMDHAGRAMDLSRLLSDSRALEDVAREALRWLDQHGEPWNSAHRGPFNRALDELTAARQLDPGQEPGSDSPAGGG